MENKKSPPIIIFCTSFLVIPIALTLIEKNNSTYFMITHSKKMFNFLIMFFPKKKIILLRSPKFNNKYFNLKNNIKKIYSIIFFKKKVKNILNKFNNSDVYFFFESFASEMAFAIKILSKKNNIFFMPEMKSKFLYFKKILSLKIFIHKLYLKAIYGLDTEIMTGQNNKNILLYSNKFFKLVNAKKIKIKINYKNLIYFQKQNFKIKNKKILFLSSGESIEQKIISLEKFRRFIKSFISQVNLKEINIKRKNSTDQIYFEENFLDEIPQYLPANLLIYNFKVIIGCHSALMFEAANNNILSISLLDLLKDSKTESASNHFKKYLIKNLKKNKKIYFPKTLKEFFYLFSRIK